MLQLCAIFFAAVAAGAINALAGGGTLITFPVLTWLGVPPLIANVTNTVALCPGYFGAAFAQREDLKGNRGRLIAFAAVSLAGGAAGAILLLTGGENTFRVLVPWLILFASILLGVQGTIRRWLSRRSTAHESIFAGMLLVGLASIYGGYFGAGMSVIILAVLGLTERESLTCLNAQKQVIALFTNVSAAVLFAFSGRVLWKEAMVMAIGAILGGVLGGRLATRVNPSTLRAIVVVTGLVVSALYFIKGT